MSVPASVEQLCSQLEKDLKVIDVSDYNEALKDILGPTISKEMIKTIPPEKLEEVLERSYQDHADSRNLLKSLVQKNASKALSVFETLSPQSVNILVGCFPDAQSTYEILDELKVRIHYGEDSHVLYLLNVTLQLLTKFDYSFYKISFLVDELCERGREAEIKPLMLVVFSLLQKKFGDDFNHKFLDEMDGLIMESEADVGNEPLDCIINILMEVYPVLSNLCSEVFLGERLVKEFKRKVLAQDDVDFTKNLLKLFSIACIDENVRVYISEQYISLLEKSINIEPYAVFTALVLVKTWSFSKLQNVTINNLADILIKVLGDPGSVEKEGLSASIEGLAYLSLKPSVKKSLRENEKVLNQLVSYVKVEKMDSNSYGCLVVLGNLSVYPEEKNGMTGPDAIRDLKSYSHLKNPSDTNGDSNIKETKDEVLKFNTDCILKNEILSMLCQKFSSLSEGSKQQVMRLIYNIIRDIQSIKECIKQGATSAILEYMVHKQGSFDLVNVYAGRALARILIYTNPSLIFNKYSPVNAVGPLFQLISKNDSAKEEQSFDSDVITVKDTYEALLALTNLASCEGAQGEDVCKRIASSDEFWTSLEDLMLDDNNVLQRSTLELIGNLMSNPIPIAAKFFNFENKHSVKNFNILIKLLDLDDAASQRAVAAIFANICTSIPFIATELSQKNNLTTKMVELLEEQTEDKELIHRVIIFFYTILEVSSDQDAVIFSDTRLANALEKVKCIPDQNREISEMVSILLAKCKSKQQSTYN